MTAKPKSEGVVPFWKWIRKPTGFDLGILEIRGTTYALQTATEQTGGKLSITGYRLTNCTNGQEYDLLLADAGGLSCECKDFLHRGSQRPCKHVSGLLRALGING